MTTQQRFDIPNHVREGQRAYRRAQNEGRTPTAAEREAHCSYEKLRWGQLNADERAAEIARSNARRAERERVFGRETRTPRQRAVNALIRLHRKQFERLLAEQETST